MEQGKAKQGKYKTTNWTSYNAALKTWAEDNDRQTWIGYNKLRGQYMSALEHAVPEQFFHDPAQCNSYGTTTPVAGLPDCPRGISAMSALGIAAAQGQKIYTITQKVYASHPNIVNTALGAHTQNTRSRVQQALDAGHEATIHERPITENGWKGAGYTLIDPTTGAGAYLIDGGSNGGFSGNEVASRTISLLNLGSHLLSAAAGIANIVINAVSFTAMWVSNVVDCYKSDLINFIGLLLIAIAAAYLISSIISGMAEIPAAVAIMVAALTPGTASAAQEKECKLQCSRANKFHFSNAKPSPIEDVELFKIEEGFGPPTSPYDVCACEDGTLVIHDVGKCGKIDWRNFPYITGHRWK